MKQREIKFKYWNGVSKIMVNEPEIRSDYKFSLNEYFTDRGWVWLQYTGLKDKNNKEIYEGDILKDERSVGDVIFNLSVGAFSWIGGEEWGVIEHNFVEVIGNIYENKELLK